MDVSVLICTYNRAHLLGDSIGALRSQQIPRDLEWEVIIVDNNSTDTTASLVAKCAGDFPVPLRYVFERRQGKCFALNTGICEARGDIIAFTDDDVLPEPNWVSSICAIMNEKKLDGTGGRILPKWEGRVPNWLQDKRHLWGYLAIVDSEETKELSLPLINGSEIWGANMAFKKSIFSEIGMFDPKTGNVGYKFYRGEEPEFLARALEGGKKVGYCPQPVVYHRIGQERMTKSFFRKVAFDGGESCGLNARAILGRSLLGAPGWLYSCAAKDFVKWLSHLVSANVDAFDYQLDFISEGGQLCGFWKKAWRGRSEKFVLSANNKK